jgi:hypothetical protein
MRAKLVSEKKETKYSDVRRSDLNFNIASAFQSLVDGDDVDYEGASEKQIKAIERILGHQINDLTEEKYIEKLSLSEFNKVYSYLKTAGWIN